MGIARRGHTCTHAQVICPASAPAQSAAAVEGIVEEAAVVVLAAVLLLLLEDTSIGNPSFPVNIAAWRRTTAHSPSTIPHADMASGWQNAARFGAPEGVSRRNPTQRALSVVVAARLG